MSFLNLCSSLVGDFGTYRQHITIQINSEKAEIPNYKAELSGKLYSRARESIDRRQRAKY